MTSDTGSFSSRDRKDQGTSLLKASLCGRREAIPAKCQGHTSSQKDTCPKQRDPEDRAIFIGEDCPTETVH